MQGRIQNLMKKGWGGGPLFWTRSFHVSWYKEAQLKKYILEPRDFSSILGNYYKSLI